jgi:DNA recombination protein RmuC
VAVLFLPIEGLFGAVVRRPGLIDDLQRDFRIMIAEPMTLLALLTSIRMGYPKPRYSEKISGGPAGSWGCEG